MLLSIEHVAETVPPHLTGSLNPLEFWLNLTSNWLTWLWLEISPNLLDLILTEFRLDSDLFETLSWEILTEHFLHSCSSLGLHPNTRSYLREYTGVFVSGVGTSFYQQCFPSSSVHLAISSAAMHYLSRKYVSFNKFHHMTSTTIPQSPSIANMLDIFTKLIPLCLPSYPVSHKINLDLMVPLFWIHELIDWLVDCFFC